MLANQYLSRGSSDLSVWTGQSEDGGCVWGLAFRVCLTLRLFGFMDNHYIHMHIYNMNCK
jgi:hypothetical protein